MELSEKIIGLSWEPKLPLLPVATSSRNHSAAGGSSSTNSTSSSPSELIDGLYVVPNDPKMLNKLFRKSLKDTAGKHWFDMPAPTLTPSAS
ncbi:hypothetical protein ACH5RR_033612 [Cinchona calisaya]|uniref:Uncharacterized protein n=1 Tax=Cinchona calisaya TaxID=153742 RepID=A0ABD2YQ13_9GENT